MNTIRLSLAGLTLFVAISSSHHGAGITREGKELQQTVIAFHRDYEQPGSNWPEEKISSYCSHPAYQSRWCNAFKQL